MVIEHKDKTIDTIPKETVDGISIYGQSQITTQCRVFFLRNNITISYFKQNGSYFGKSSGVYNKDYFNVLLNIGYSILNKELLGEIENRGLSPFAGFMHEDKTGHASIASDLI